MRKQTYKQTNKLPAGANATYEISVMSYTYAAKGDIMWSEIHCHRAPAKNCAVRFCEKRSCYGATLQVAIRRLALSGMNSDAVSYTYAPKRIMWRLITNKEDIKYKLYRMQYEKFKTTESRQR